MIRFEHVDKWFGALHALKDMHTTVEAGEITGLLGPNGAGKTTFMRLLTGFFPATSGQVFVNDVDMAREPHKVQSHIGYLPEGAPLYRELTAEEMVRYAAELRGVDASMRTKAVDRAFEECGIANMKRRLIGTLSKGYRQRVALASALVGDPPFLILDEPTGGLDPEQITEIRRLIRNLSGKRTVLISTHILSEIDSLTDRVLIISEGRLVAADRIERLRKDFSGSHRIEMAVEGPEGAVSEALKKIKGVRSVTPLSREGAVRRYALDVADPEEAPARLSEETVRAGFRVTELTKPLSRLEDIYLDVVRTHALRKSGEANEETFAGKS